MKPTPSFFTTVVLVVGIVLMLAVLLKDLVIAVYKQKCLANLHDDW